MNNVMFFFASLQVTRAKIASSSRIHVKMVNVKMGAHALGMQHISGLMALFIKIVYAISTCN